MFRRKSGEPDEARRDQKGDGDRTISGRVGKLRRAVPGATGTTVMFHPDVPQGAPEAAPAEVPPRVEGDAKRLTVGRETTISGCTVVDCERLTVEGVVEGSMAEGRLLEIAKGGCFRGTVVVDNAEIAGVFEGEIKVKKRLSIRSSGCVSGTVRYGQLEVERGGRIGGNAEYDPADREADLQPVALPPSAASEGSSQGV